MEADFRLLPNAVEAKVVAGPIGKFTEEAHDADGKTKRGTEAKIKRLERRRFRSPGSLRVLIEDIVMIRSSHKRLKEERYGCESSSPFKLIRINDEENCERNEFLLNPEPCTSNLRTFYVLSARFEFGVNSVSRTSK